MIQIRSLIFFLVCEANPKSFMHRDGRAKQLQISNFFICHDINGFLIHYLQELYRFTPPYIYVFV